MSFAPQEEFLSDDTDITGYTIVRHSPPFSVAGSPGVPAKLGELRRFLSLEHDSFKKIADARFIANTDGTVLDTKTNLMWAAKDNGSDIKWKDAKSYCDNYRGGGYTDWRMPMSNELAGLYDRLTVGNNGYHLTTLINLSGCYLWAYKMRGSDAIDEVHFDDQLRFWSHSLHRVLPVRSVNANGVASDNSKPILIANLHDLPVKPGDTIEQVRTAYHTSAEPEPINISNKPGAKVLRLQSEGVLFLFDQTGKIYTIRLKAPFQGSVKGVKIGESLEMVLKSLGEPTRKVPNRSPFIYFYIPAGLQLQFNPAGVVEVIFLTK